MPSRRDQAIAEVLERVETEPGKVLDLCLYLHQTDKRWFADDIKLFMNALADRYGGTFNVVN